MGVNGIALAFTISNIINSILLITIYNIKNHDIINTKLFYQLIKTIISSLVLLIVLYTVNNFYLNNLNSLSIIIIDIAISIFIYLFMCIILKNKEVLEIIKVIKNKFNKDGDIGAREN